MPIRNPIFPQSPRLPLDKEKLRNLTKLRKKLVKNNGFGKINAIWPKIKAKRGRTRKYENGDYAKFGGLVKELGKVFLSVLSNYINFSSRFYQKRP